MLTSVSPSLCQEDNALQYVAFPRYLASIGSNAFPGCISLRQIVCPLPVPLPVDESVFSGVDQPHCQLIVPAASVEAYRKADVWKEFDIVFDGMFTVTASVVDDAAGYTTGSGAYLYGEQALLQAYANNAYEFISWNDGVTDNPRSLRVTQDTLLQAQFQRIIPEIPYYTLTVTANDYNMGNVIGGGQYMAGSDVVIVAMPYTGYCVDTWSCEATNSTTLFYSMPAEDATVTVFFKKTDMALDYTESFTAPQKVLINGHIYILHNNNLYTPFGTQIR